MNVRVVLVRPRNPLNIGAAARAMANFGLSDLVAVEPYGPSWRTARSAVGAEKLLREARLATIDEALEDRDLVLGTSAARRREIRQPLVDLPALRGWLDERSPSRVALLFGSEKHGLTNEAFERCHALLRVPTSEATPSMNLSHSVAVVAYELARKPSTPKSDAPTAPNQRQLDDLLAKALAAFEKVGYMDNLPKSVRIEKVRRRLLQWRLSKQDAALMQSFLKRVAG